MKGLMMRATVNSEGPGAHFCRPAPFDRAQARALGGKCLVLPPGRKRRLQASTPLDLLAQRYWTHCPWTLWLHDLYRHRDGCWRYCRCGSCSHCRHYRHCRRWANRQRKSCHRRWGCFWQWSHCCRWSCCCHRSCCRRQSRGHCGSCHWRCGCCHLMKCCQH